MVSPPVRLNRASSHQGYSAKGPLPTKVYLNRSGLFIWLKAVLAQGCFGSRLFMSAQGCLFGSGLLISLRAVYLAQGCFWLRAVYFAQGCFWLRAVYFAQGCLFRSGLFWLRAVYVRSGLFISAQGCLFPLKAVFWLRAVYFRSRLFFGSGLSRVAHPPDERLSPPKTANLALEHLILQPLSSARDGPSKSHKAGPRSLSRHCRRGKTPLPALQNR